MYQPCVSAELNKIGQINSIYVALKNLLIYQYHQFPPPLIIASETSYTLFSAVGCTALKVLTKISKVGKPV